LPQHKKNEESISGAPDVKESDIKKPDDKGNNRINDDNEYFRELSEKIVKYLETDKPFLNPDFSVHDICVKLNVPRHHIQYCLNVVMNKKFSDLKNEMRVNFTIDLLQTKALDNMSIDGIGKISGFASPSNFFSTFKKITGVTPNQWMQNHRNFMVSCEVAVEEK
jgi:AraC-like DNA-binding protein